MSGGFLQVPPVGDQPPGRFRYQAAKSSPNSISPGQGPLPGTEDWGVLAGLNPASQGWWDEQDLNLQPPACKAGTLPLSYHPVCWVGFCSPLQPSWGATLGSLTSMAGLACCWWDRPGLNRYLLLRVEGCALLHHSPAPQGFGCTSLHRGLSLGAHRRCLPHRQGPLLVTW
jgi:hypothetical protein